MSSIQSRSAKPRFTRVGRVSWPEISIPQSTIPITVRGRTLLVESDEFGGGGSLPVTGTHIGASRLIDVSEPAQPKVLSNLRLQVHEPGDQEALEADTLPLIAGPYTGHYCSVPQAQDPGIVACSALRSGLRIFDIRDPDDPREVAYVSPLASQNTADGLPAGAGARRSASRRRPGPEPWAWPRCCCWPPARPCGGVARPAGARVRQDERVTDELALFELPAPAAPAPTGPPVIAATDGSCNPNPGTAAGAWFVSPRCWGVVVLPGSGTNNMGELAGIRALLLAVPAAHPLEIVFDSTYARDCVTTWAPGWSRNGSLPPERWLTKARQPVKNATLIAETVALLQGRSIRWTKATAHVAVAKGGHLLNHEADRVAGAAVTAVRAGRSPELGPGWTG